MATKATTTSNSKTLVTIKFKGKTYKVPSYLELVEDAPGFILTQAGAGDEQAGMKLLVHVIEKLEEGPFKELITTVPSAIYSELVEAWTQGEVGK